MKIEKAEFDEERFILIGMIVDKHVLGRVFSKWKGQMFRSPWSNKVGRWCINYYKRFKKSPGRNIQIIYNNWASEAKNKEQVEVIGDFLHSLSRQYQRLRKESNSDYVIDMAGRLFNKIRLERLSESIDSDIDDGELDRAIKKVNDFHRVDMGVGEGIDPISDEAAIEAAFAELPDPLIKYSKGLEKFFKNILLRDNFVAILAPEKRGKSFWLMDMAFRAITINGRKVAFFECGDLSKNQIIKRFMVRVANWPMWPGKVYRPEIIEYIYNKKGRIIGAETDGDTFNFNNGLTLRKSLNACRALLEKKKLKDVLRLSIHPNSTISVQGIRDILSEWERDGWIPDVVVIDYADILDMSASGLEGRDRIDNCWKQLRRLSQELHCLLLTATQGAATSYKKKLLTKSDFSDDKRKHAHVTGMFGLNQTWEEKKQGIMRLNWLDKREGKFDEKECCYVATCVELANMAVRSIF